MKSSEYSGFYKLPVEKRDKEIQEFAELTEEDVKTLLNFGSLGEETADRMIENVFAGHTLPVGLATNFVVNGKDYLVPMCIEEPSVVAAASNAAKIARKKGGFTAKTTAPLMIGQIQVVGIEPEKTEEKMNAVLEKKKGLLEFANTLDPILVKFGGGARDIEGKLLEHNNGKFILFHLVVDVRDAMGANAVNTMCEKLAPKIEELTGGSVVLRIISNLATKRMVRVSATFPKEDLGGEEAVDRIVDAYTLARETPYRAATHNKGIMNGIDAVVLATGNDWRAVEAGAHAYAAITGKYKPLTRWWKNDDGDLEGVLEVPMAVGLVGGATKTHPTAKVAVKILGVKTAQELSQVIGAVGLAQNFGALRALAMEGIQRGHMKLHARNIAVMAGAKGEQVDKVAAKMVEEKTIRVDKAKEILAGMQAQA